MNSSRTDLFFLKLGGSLITDKNQPHTPRPEVIQRLSQEITSARLRRPGLRLILGHGSGSFGHYPARKFGTRGGVKNSREWSGFVEVWREAAQLNRLVMDALVEAGLPAVVFPPSACVVAKDAKIERWDTAPIQMALEAGLLPVVYGDAAFDLRRGGTILSTEDLFSFLADLFQPQKILLAGIEPGVFRDLPGHQGLVNVITPQDHLGLEQAIGGSAAIDVTGGMASKVNESLDLVRRQPGLEIEIFSGEMPGLVERVLLGERVGTLIRADF